MDLTKITNRDMIGAFLTEHFPNGLGVEVGCLNGVNARNMVSTWNCRLMYLVDTWGTHIPELYRERTDWTNFLECKRECEILAKDYPGRVKLHQGKSLDCVGVYPDESFEFIYLDGAHDYHSVIADCVAWWPKLKKGGLLGMHDANYNDTVWPAYNEVKRAIESWMPFMSLEPHITHECSSAWVEKK